MINILQISGEPVGGVRKHVHSILNGINKKNFNIYYCYSNVNKDSKFSKEIEFMNIKVENILQLKICKKPHLSDIINIYKLINFIHKNNIDIVHGHGAKGGMYARIVKLFINSKTIYTPHGGVLHNSFGTIPDFIYKTVEKSLIPLTDTVVVESKYSKNKYIEKIGDIREKLVLNYNGVSYIESEEKINIPHVLENKKNNEIHLSIFARLHYMKGQDIAIKALQYLPDNYVLNLFGEGEEKEILEEIVKNLNLERRVYFHGDTSYPEDMMKYIDIIIIPSSFESFSYVAAEGLMMKKLVVANNVGGLKEVLAENSGILIEDIDEHKLSDSIKKLLKDEIAYVILNGNKRYIKYFQENNMVINLEKIYKNIIL